jgi:hypothetical protein
MAFLCYTFPMARVPNTLRTVVVKLSTTGLIVEYLEDLVKTGFYGKNSTEAAERLLAATLNKLVRDGELPRRGPD